MFFLREPTLSLRHPRLQVKLWHIFCLFFQEKPTKFSSTFLLLYLTKALTHDQEATLKNYLSLLRKDWLGRSYDGDTPQDKKREESCQEGDFFLTKFAMLPSGRLPNHNSWPCFWVMRRALIVDELPMWGCLDGT